MSTFSLHKPLLKKRKTGAVVWIAYLSSVIAGITAAIGVYRLTGAISLRSFIFEHSFRSPLHYLEPVLTIIFALVILGFASKSLGWKTTGVFIVTLLFFFSAPHIYVLYSSVSGLEKQNDTMFNVSSFADSLNEILTARKSIPARLSDIQSIKGFYSNAYGNKEDFETTSRQTLGQDWDEFMTIQRNLYGWVYAPVMNLATGYETGRDYFEWWNCFPAKKHRDEKSVAIRKIMAGNFVYIPLDASGDMLPYDSDLEAVKSAVLYGFGPSNRNGKDIWTPTGDPNKPVTLKPDGIPDGIIKSDIVGVGMVEDF